MKRLSGNIGGLKANQIHRLENLYRRRVPPDWLVTAEIAREISQLSHEIRRQIGLLINRKGKIALVIIGDHRQITIPDLQDYRIAPGRLRGVRCVHTHLRQEPLTEDDFNDLVLLRLDMMAVIRVGNDGDATDVSIAHVLPGSSGGKPFRELETHLPHQLDIGCDQHILALEDELSRRNALHQATKGLERALLIGVTTDASRKARESLQELQELARSSRIDVIDTILQQRDRPDHRFVLGKGKLQELNIIALQKGISMLIFDQELGPAQIRSITNETDVKVLDRTQLILDIFAQRAQTREGKLQVELAQLRYLLPRLITKNTAMSRLTGGIGGRGPGETKLEINRRRVRDRILRIENSLQDVKKHRKQQRSRRKKRLLPIISIIGYTNAGKSTLLNTLTKSDVRAESRLFATLDPSSRRLKFPRDTEVIITDTVGFIRDLPQDLRVAFQATLEELENADLLLHVIDSSNPRISQQISAVEQILEDLEIRHIPMIRVLNKVDRISETAAKSLEKKWRGVPVSAIHRKTLIPLV
jgi:GTP-binding protein HflX